MYLLWQWCSDVLPCKSHLYCICFFWQWLADLSPCIIHRAWVLDCVCVFLYPVNSYLYFGFCWLCVSSFYWAPSANSTVWTCLWGPPGVVSIIGEGRKDLNDTHLLPLVYGVKFNGFRRPFVFLINGSGRMSEFRNSNTLNKQALRNKVQKLTCHRWFWMYGNSLHFNGNDCLFHTVLDSKRE